MSMEFDVLTGTFRIDSTLIYFLLLWYLISVKGYSIQHFCRFLLLNIRYKKINTCVIINRI